MNVNIKRLNEAAVIPQYAHEGDAGFDLVAVEDVIVEPGETVKVPTGLAFEIPDGYAGLVYARSGLASKNNLAPANKVGVIDSDYRGEAFVALHNHGETPQTVQNDQRIAQLIITPVLSVQFEETTELSDTQRGAGGFGSSGKF